jgi:hypothetical protein
MGVSYNLFFETNYHQQDDSHQKLDLVYIPSQVNNVHDHQWQLQKFKFLTHGKEIGHTHYHDHPLNA